MGIVYPIMCACTYFHNVVALAIVVAIACSRRRRSSRCRSGRGGRGRRRRRRRPHLRTCSRPQHRRRCHVVPAAVRFLTNRRIFSRKRLTPFYHPTTPMPSSHTTIAFHLENPRVTSSLPVPCGQAQRQRTFARVRSHVHGTSRTHK